MRDSTATAAIARLRFQRPSHAAGCWVNGGPHTHRLKGFRCPRCAHDRDEETR